MQIISEQQSELQMNKTGATEQNQKGDFSCQIF